MTTPRGILRLCTVLAVSAGAAHAALAQSLESSDGAPLELRTLSARATLEGRTAALVFLTDGCPTEGVTVTDTILRTAKEAAGGRVRAFVFGIGHDVNTVLLDTLAGELRGARDYVEPGDTVGDPRTGASIGVGGARGGMFGGRRGGQRTDPSDPLVGTWDPADPASGDLGRARATAYKTMCLEVYYRYARVLGTRGNGPAPVGEDAVKASQEAKDLQDATSADEAEKPK